MKMNTVDILHHQSGFLDCLTRGFNGLHDEVIDVFVIGIAGQFDIEVNFFTIEILYSRFSFNVYGFIVQRALS